jgi:hypothetical protein
VIIHSELGYCHRTLVDGTLSHGSNTTNLATDYAATAICSFNNRKLRAKEI